MTPNRTQKRILRARAKRQTAKKQARMDNLIRQQVNRAGAGEKAGAVPDL